MSTYTRDTCSTSIGIETGSSCNFGSRRCSTCNSSTAHSTRRSYCSSTATDNYSDTADIVGIDTRNSNSVGIDTNIDNSACRSNTHLPKRRTDS